MSLTSFRNRTNNASKVVLWIAVIAMVGGGGFMGLGAINQFGSAGGAAHSESSVVATVNGDSILQSDFEQQLQQNSQQGQGAQSMFMSGIADNRALDNLISQKLILQVAKKHHIVVADSEVAAAREKEIDKLKTNLGLSHSASEDAVRSKLSSMNYSLDSMIPSDDKLKDEVMVQKYAEMVKALSAPSEAQLEASFSKFHTQHILIDNKKRPDAQALAIAAKIISELNSSKGANFNALVKQYSDDPGTKNRNGDDGWIDDQTPYDQAFKDAAFALAPGQWSQTPVKSDQFGYFIIKLDAKKVNKPKDFDKNKARYVEQATDDAMNKAIDAELQQARSAAKINVVDPHLDGDWLFMNAYQDMMTNPSAGKNPGSPDLSKALAAYDKALKDSPNSTDTAQIQCQRAVIFQAMKKTPDMLAALIAAYNATKGYDVQIDMKLADTYKTMNDSTNALKYYNLAEEYAGQNISVHMELQSAYKALGQKDLAQKEKAWVADYNSRNKNSGNAYGANSMQIPAQ